MTEGRKTGIFALIAGVTLLLAWATTTRNTTVDSDATKLIGKTLFEKFTDPLSAASLKILRYDSNKESLEEFEVTKDRTSGAWTIPSHESYPADASSQMANAATLFVGLKSIDVASQKREDQTLFGVIEPNKQKEDQGGQGVGMLVQMRDDKGDILTDLIIGKETDGKKRFVRVPSEDVIYVVDLDPAPLSTEFKQWIEPDLLKLSSNDVETVGIRDYQIVPTNQGMVLTRNYEADINYVNATGQWQASRISTFETDPPADKLIGENEQLNAAKLTDLKNALDSLKIADVAKKPAGLAADLKGDKAKLGNDALSSLSKRGFFPNPNQKEGEVVDFYSKNGELQVSLKDGVQYLLRFGGSATADVNKAEVAGQEESVSINRYLLVTARVDESKFPQPTLERVPETIDELKAIESLKNAAGSTNVPVVVPADAGKETMPEAPAVGNAPVDPSAPAPSEEAKPEEAKPASPEEGAKPALPDGTPGEAPKGDNQANLDSKAAVKLVKANLQEKAGGSEEGAPQEGTKPGTPDSSTPAQEPVANATPTNPSASVPAQEPTEEEWKERLEAARDRITKENNRKLEDRQEKLKAARTKVAELNGRFADWYYIVSESDFNKLRIEMKDLIQPKATPSAPGFGSGPAGGSLPPGLNIPGLGGPNP